MEGYHSTVLLNEVLEVLRVRDAWYLDATAGDGGHSIEVISRGGKVICIDVDPQALERVQKRFEDSGIDSSKYKLILGNFRDIKKLIAHTQYPNQFAGAIFDLGVSSLQLETLHRGFSFARMGPLDMRMDPALKISASDLIKAGGRKELYELFKNLGEEKYSGRLAEAIISARQIGEIKTTLDLAQIIEKAVGRKGKIHPATRVFQALRIAVNDELAALMEGLDQVIDLIVEGGKIVVISFHSLEDRIVKNTFKKWEKLRLGKVLTKRPITPGEGEIMENPRSRSAKLRVFEKAKG